MAEQPGEIEDPDGWRRDVARLMSTVTIVGLSAIIGIVTASGMTPGSVLLLQVVLGSLVLLLVAERWIDAGWKVRGGLVVFVFWLAVTVASAIVGMLAGPTGGLFMCTMCAAVLFDRRTVAVVLTACVASVLLSAGLQVMGLTPSLHTGDIDWSRPRVWIRTSLVAVVLVIMGTALVSFVVGRLEQALKDARASAEALVEAERARRRAMEIATEAQKIELVGRLSAVVAHDLRNDLAAIELCNNAIARDVDDPRRIELHRGITDSIARSHGMLERLRAFMAPNPEPGPVDVGELLERFAPTIGGIMPQTVQVDVHGCPGVWAPISTARLEQAVLNLVVNAKDAMPEGGLLTVRCEVIELDGSEQVLGESLEPGTYVAISVEDTGCGMTPDIADLAFEMTFSTKPHGKGTGLGLPSVLHTARLHGGDVMLRTAPGEGTLVSILLPVLPTPTAEPISEELTPITLSGARILLAEDMDELRTRLAELLSTQGCIVVQARDGTEALAAVQEQGPFDLLCSDVMMPGVPLAEVLDAFRVHEPYGGIVLISALGEDNPALAGLEPPVLRKPFEPQELFRALTDALPVAPHHRS